MSPVVFYFPFQTVGGVSVLFLRLARKLVKTRRVFIMDSPSGYMASNLPSGCDFIRFDQPNLIPADALVVFQSVPPWRIQNIEAFPRTARLLLWNLHPYNLNPLLFQKGSRLESLWFFDAANGFFSTLRKRSLVRLCRMLCKKKSLVFMDEENRRTTLSTLGLNISADLLPITTEDVAENLKFPTPPRSGNRIRAIWIGRLDDFKIPILLHTLTRLDAIDSLRFEFEIIGDGAQRDTVIEHVSTLKNLEVRFRGHVNHTLLDEELRHQHIVFAMGTSALDSARLGLPTFCLDFSYRKIDACYRFRLLRNAKGYNVGEEITDSHLESSSSLESTLHELLNNYEHESLLAHRYWKDNHSPEAVVQSFMQHSEFASATFADLVRSGLHLPDIVTLAICKCDPRKVQSTGFILR